MNKLKKIDFDKKRFESNEKQYIITDQFGYKRLSAFLDKVPVIALGKTSIEVVNAMRVVFNYLTSGNDIAKSLFDATNYLFNFLDSARDTTSNDYLLAHLDYYLEFCSIFCVTEDEDLTQWNEDIAKLKIDDWKKDMDMTDFFFLAKKQVPRLPNLLNELEIHAGKRKK